MTLNTKPIESGMSGLRDNIREVCGTLPTTYIDRIISLCMDECIDAINQKPFNMSSTEFPYKREHQEEGLNIAIEAIESLKTTDSNQ